MRLMSTLLSECSIFKIPMVRNIWDFELERWLLCWRLGSQLNIKEIYEILSNYCIPNTIPWYYLLFNNYFNNAWMPEWFQMRSEREKVPSALSFLSPSPRGSCGLSSVKGISQVGPFAQQRLRNTNPAVYTPWWLILLPAPQLHTAVSSLAFQPEVDQDF